ncbi:MAG: hypothetical protein GEU73_05140 [Chloroflexi bacterium]|nr:hypothetical protein [Chloroflexota bacterium]
MNQRAFDLHTEPGERYRRVQDSEPGFSHRNAGPTEIAGALAQVPVSGKNKLDLLKVYADAGWRGYSDMELHFKTGIAIYSINSRRNTLIKHGWVEDSGKVRPSPTSRLDVKVWRITDKGIRALRSAS